MTIFLRLAVSVLLGAGGLALGSAPTPPLDARAVWEAVIAAKGGHERLRNVRSFVISFGGKINTSRPDIAPKLDLEQVAFLRYGYWQWVDARPGAMGVSLTVYSLTTHRYWLLWVSHESRDKAIEDTSAKQLEDELELSYFLETSDLQPELIEVVAPNRNEVILQASVLSQNKLK